MSMNFPPRNSEGYYAYSSRVGGRLCLIIDVGTLPLLLRSTRHMNPPILFYFPFFSFFVFFGFFFFFFPHPLAQTFSTDPSTICVHFCTLKLQPESEIN